MAAQAPRDDPVPLQVSYPTLASIPTHLHGRRVIRHYCPGRVVDISPLVRPSLRTALVPFGSTVFRARPAAPLRPFPRPFVRGRRFKMLARKSVRSGTRARALSPSPPSPASSSSSSALPPSSPPKRVLKRPVAPTSRPPPGSLPQKRRSTTSAPSASPHQCSCSPVLRAMAHSDRFVSSSAATAWESYSDHPLLVERNICDASFESSGFLPFLSDLGLHRIAHLYSFYWPSLVREFYCNLKSPSSDPSSQWFGRVYIRGHIVAITPAAINSVLGWTTPSFDEVFDASDVPSKTVLAQTLTGGSLTSWPAVGSLRAASLTVKYFLLFKVLVNTVCPSSNVVKLSYDMAVILFLLVCKKPVNLGRFVFDRMVQHAEVPQGNAALPFACLISRFLEELPCFEPPPLTKLPVAVFKYSAKYHDKLFDLPAVQPRPTPVDPPADCSASTVPGSSQPSSAVPPPSAQPSSSSLAELVARLKVAYASSARLRAEQSVIDVQIQDLHSAIFAALSGSPPL